MQEWVGELVSQVVKGGSEQRVVVFYHARLVLHEGGGQEKERDEREPE
jgi:hypothetical protein